MIGVGSPSRRLNSRPVRVGSASARRSAASPVRTSPSARSSDDRRDRRRALAELEDLESIAARDRGRGVGRPEVDPERVGHHSPRTMAGPPSLPCGGWAGRYTRGPGGGSRTSMPAGTVAAPATGALEELDRALVADARSLATRLDRDDLADRLGAIRHRAGRTDTVVCVVGEFKKGKSALDECAARQPGLPGRRRSRDGRRHGRPLRRDAERHGPPPRGWRARSSKPSTRPRSPAWAQEVAGRERRQDVDLVEVAPAAPAPRGRTDDRRHARCGRPQRGPCGGHAGVPALGRCARVRDRCVRRAVRAGARVPGQRARRRPADPRSPSPRSTSTRNGGGSSTSTSGISRRSAWPSGRSG